MKKINNRRKIGILGISLLSAAFTLTCFTFVTIAWFSSVKSVNISYDQIEVDDGVSFEIKYFNMNADSGGNFKGYQNPATNLSVQVSDYSTDFITISDPSALDGALNGKYLYPDMCHTYAIEVTNISASPRDVSLILNKFTCAWQTNVQCYDVTDPENIAPIYLSSAINMYSYSTVYNSSTISGIANNFVKRDASLSLSDKFSQGGQGGSDVSIGLSNTSELQVGEKAIIFFTLEFSNDSSTFYSYHSSSTTTIDDITTSIYNYEKDINGSSNVYQKMSFVIDTLSIHVGN